MMMRKLTMAAAMAATALTGLPTAALAHGHGNGHHKHHHHYYDDGYRERSYDDRPRYYRESYSEPRRYYDGRGCRTGGTTGLIIGGAAGALLGREIDGGRDRTAGTVIGAGTGALLGREISRKSHC